MPSVQSSITTNDIGLPAKSIGMTLARKNLSRLVDEVQFWSNSFVIKKNGKVAAALVPIYVLEQWHIARAARFAVNNRIHQQTLKLNLSEDEINTMIDDAIDEVRLENVVSSQK